MTKDQPADDFLTSFQATSDKIIIRSFTGDRDGLAGYFVTVAYREYKYLVLYFKSRFLWYYQYFSMKLWYPYFTGIA